MRKAGWVWVVVMAVGAAGMVATGQDAAGAGTPPRVAPARPRPDGEWRGAGGGFDAGEGMLVRLLENSKLAKEAGVTEEQIAAVKTKLDVLRKEQIDLRAELEKAGMEQARLIADKSVEETALMAAVDKTSEVNAKMARNRMKQLLIVKQTLTPEQTEKIRAVMRERIGKNRDGAGRMDRGPRQGDKSGATPPPPPVPPAP